MVGRHSGPFYLFSWLGSRGGEHVFAMALQAAHVTNSQAEEQMESGPLRRISAACSGLGVSFFIII